ncbi:MAG: glycosyltransferase family 2 protein [Candidatus Levyibacteriota bacterium]|jgi:GT2 family glycosyltransferase
MDLSIIILSFNTQDLTIACLNAIVAQYQQELDNNTFEIILIDNASSDGTVKAVKSLNLKNLKVIESRENLGFSKGCNLGAEKASGEYLLFLNSDTEIKDQGFAKMVDYLRKNEKVGILGAALKNDNGTAQPSAGKFYNLFNLFLMMVGLERVGLLSESPQQIKQVDWVSGASLMISKKLFQKSGGFAKELFMYVEDMELCYKAKRKGFATYFYPEVTLFHKQRGSSNRTFAILNIYKGILFFYKKHKPNWEYKIASAILFVKAYCLGKVGKFTKNKYLEETYGQALELF